MGNIIGRGIKIEVAATYGTAITLTAISLAVQAVINTTTPPVLNTVGYVNAVVGMAQAEGQAVRAKTIVAATSFVAQGFDTTSFGVASTSAQFIPVATWETLSEATAYQSAGGDANKVDVTRLIDDITQEENGRLAAQSLTIPILAQDVSSNAMALLEAAAISQGYVVIRITLKSGAVRVLRGQPSLPGEDVQSGQAGTGSIGISIKGQILKGVA
jgi:hypothetical protein